MNILFIHQNFPGQFRHLANYFAAQSDCKVIGVGEALNHSPKNLGYQTLFYAKPQGSGRQTHHYLRPLESCVRRGQKVARTLIDLKRMGFTPNLVCVHPGWGEGLYIKDIYPDAQLVNHCEFYYHSRNSNIDFDPEFPSDFDDLFRIRTLNSNILLSLIAADRGVSPTEYQRSRFPPELQSKIDCIHEGIDTERLRPRPEAQFTHPNLGAAAQPHRRSDYLHQP